MVPNTYFRSLVLALLFPLSTFAAKWHTTLDRSAVSLEIENRINSMSLKQKIGQLFIFGFRGTEPDASLLSTIQELNPGAIIVFGRNIKTARQMANLNFHAQQASFRHSKIPLLIALDQEGGDVTRIKLNPPLPSALSIGMAGDPIIAERVGYLIAQIISSIGFNMNLAPVLDLSDPRSRSFIGTRSFGHKPGHVAMIASAFARGMEEAGILSTGKHFPGHGNTIGDSHKSLPLKRSTFSDLITSDLMPYSMFLSNLRSSAIMVAHVAFPNIDQTRTPATFSKPIVDGILRNHLKYDGIVMTDDLEMAATMGIGKFEDRVIKAFQAGVDMLMVAWSRNAQRKAVRALVNSVQKGEIAEEKIDAAVRRILLTKSKYLSFQKPKKPDFEKFRSVVKSDYIRNLADTLLEKNFYRSLGYLNEKSFVWTKEPTYIFSADKAFYREFQKSTNTKAYWVPYFSNRKELYSRKMQKNQKSYGVFYVTGKISARMANSLPAEVKKRTLVINSSAPASISRSKQFLGTINIFSKHPMAGRLVAENIVRGASSVRGPASKE